MSKGLPGKLKKHFKKDNVFNRDVLKDLDDDLIDRLAKDYTNEWTKKFLTMLQKEGYKYNPVRQSLVSKIHEGGSDQDNN